MKHLIIFFITACCVNTLSGQNSANREFLLGKWKLDIIRDSADIAIDFVSTSEKGIPDILPYLTFKANKILLLHGNAKWKGKWHIKSNKLSIDVKNSSPLSYQLIELSENVLTLEHIVILADKEEMAIKLFYKKYR